MADYDISNVPRRVVYAASGVGPYAFTFEVLSSTDIAVYKGDQLLTLTTDYTVSIASNGTGSITLVSTAGTSNITIVGAKTIARTTDFTTGGDFFANTLNDELDAQTIFVQQVAETAERGLKAPVTDPTDINMTLPSRTSRAGKTLAFDASGNPAVGEDIGNWRGDWAAGTSYTVRDLVRDASNLNVYRCNTAHTSSGVAPISTNTDSAKWDVVIAIADVSDLADAAAASAVAADASADAAALSETAAASSASTATTKASEAASSASSASSSASSASTSAGTATTKASEASASASSAATAKTAAELAETNAETAEANAETAQAAAEVAKTAAELAETNAETAETNAETAATLAQDWAIKTSAPVSGGEYSAKYHAQAASTSAGSASSSASSASSAQVAAESARDATLAAFDSFDDRYLGSKTSDPALDNDGNPLVAGALYFNSVSGVMNVYTGSAWVAAYVSGSGYLAAANNLSDLASASTSRTNLGVTATGSDTTYAYRANNLSDLASASNARTNLGLAIGTDVQAYSAQLQSYATNGVAMRNRIINGAMVIDQRNAGASVTIPITAVTYTLDRWAAYGDQGSKFSVQQNAGSVTPPTGFSNYLGCTSLSAYSVTSVDTFVINQRIEGFNTADLGWGTANAKTVTMSFWVYSSLTGTFGGSITNGAFSYSYPFSYSIPVANTWTQISVTIAGPTAGTWIGATNGIGMRVYFSLGAGSSVSGTAGSWSANGYVSATGATSVVGTSGATFYITGVQLEAGSVATGFEYRQYGTELALNQRYFQKTYNIDTAPGATGGYAGGIYSGAIYNVKGTTAGVNDVNITWQYKTSMRTSPTITFYSPSSGTAGNFTAGSIDNTAGINAPIIGENNSLGYGTASASGSSNDCYFHMTASAEL